MRQLFSRVFMPYGQWDPSMLTRHSLLLIPSTILMLVPQGATAQLVTELAPSPDKPSAQVNFVVASPDGTILATVGDDAAFWHKNETTPFFSLPTKASNYSPGFSGDGRRFVYSGVDEQNEYAAIVVDVARKQLIRRIRWWGYYMALNTDGSELALVVRDEVHFHDVRTGESSGRLSCDDEIQAIAYSPDGAWLAVSLNSEKDQIQVFDAESRQLVSTSKSFAPATPRQMFFSADSKILFTPHEELLLSWDPATGKKCADIPAKLRHPQRFRSPRCFAVSANKRFVATAWESQGDNSACLVISDSHDAEICCVLPLTKAPKSVAFVRDDFVATAAGNSYAYLWHWTQFHRFDDRPLASLEIRGALHQDDQYHDHVTYRRLLFSPDSSTIAIAHAGPLPGKGPTSPDDGNSSKYVTFVDVPAAKVALVFSPKSLRQGQTIWDMAYTPDGALQIAADGLVGRWDSLTKRFTNLLEDKDASFLRIGFDVSGNRCVIVREKGETYFDVYSMQDGKLLLDASHKKGYRVYGQGFAVSPDGNVIARGLEIISAKDAEGVQLASSNVDPDAFTPEFEVFSSDGRRIFGYDELEGVVVWDLDSNDVTRPIPLFREEGAFAISPDAKYIVIGQADGLIRLWNLETRSALVTFRGHAGAIATLAFAPNGSKFASLSADRTLKIWDLTTYIKDASPRPVR